VRQEGVFDDPVRGVKALRDFLYRDFKRISMRAIDLHHDRHIPSLEPLRWASRRGRAFLLLQHGAKAHLETPRKHPAQPRAVGIE